VRPGYSRYGNNPYRYIDPWAPPGRPFAPIRETRVAKVLGVLVIIAVVTFPLWLHALTGL
jgi:hypothetical protein